MFPLNLDAIIPMNGIENLTPGHEEVDHLFGLDKHHAIMLPDRPCGRIAKKDSSVSFEPQALLIILVSDELAVR